ncbi:MAG TPA: OB-fold domain-containing protein [Acidimicrobiales bacterium]|jgi:hypothetical protein|nr:OB-fold domain-containing protein [Acidimicrobiales bacterium]
MSDDALLAAAARLLGPERGEGELATSELALQRCDDCGYVRHPPAPRCPECLGASAHWQPDAGLGYVWSVCVYHRAYDPAFADAVPYNVALVELDAGPRLISNVLDVAPGELRIGLRVVASPREVLPGRFLVYFAPDRRGARS